MLLPTPNAVATGQTSTFNLDLGKRYHALWLELGDTATIAGTTVAAVLANTVDQIRLKVNGKVQRTMLATELHAINGLMGATFAGKSTLASLSGGLTAGSRILLPIWLAEPWRNNNAEAALTAWNAAGIDSLQLEVDLHSGLTAPILTGFYEYDAPTGGMGAIVKWIRQTFGASGTAQDFNSISKLDWLQSLHLWPIAESPTVTKVAYKVKFTANNVAIRDLLTRRENDAVLAGRNMNPTVFDTTSDATARASGVFNLVFDYDDPVNSALNANGLNEMTLHVEFADNAGAAASASGSMVAIIQRTGAPE